MDNTPRATSTWNRLFRQLHRWLAVIFTATIVITTVALLQKEPIIWVSYVPLLPLALLLITGLYLFALPYTTRRRTGRRAAGGQ